ncbi:MAG TPA: DUF4172 domain-containing protein [Ottowia sp.]|uniref:DUF4172 domain-containing protein n=1 Tax=Ottowia sp. TaxID=1898956 RepID=UPI002B8EEBEE|nr:DUF4172 domain-containing protein [Ottowia sp.]HMN22245.1 DUF4172 domain-containing protein [Ottowia sp.]
MPWVWHLADWPHFRWCSSLLDAEERHFIEGVSITIGSLRHLPASERDDLAIALLERDALGTSAIEGELLDRDSVRSSLRKHLGLAAAASPLVQCFTLSGTYNESPRGQLRGAWPQAWWVHVKATQQSRWPLGGSPCGKPEKGSRRRCSSCQGRQHWLRTAPCRKPFSGFYKCLIA